MRKLIVGKLLPLVIFTLLANATLASQPEILILSSLAKVPKSNLPPTFTAQFETSPIIHAAWGEGEALQILVRGGEDGLRNLRVSCGEFSHPDGDLWEPGSVTAAFVGYVKTAEPYYGTLRVGDWADPILPDREVQVAAGENRSIWIEVAVPLDATQGRYRGEILLEAEGWSRSVPLEIEVWGFDLPESPSLASSFMIYPRYIYQFHELEKGSEAGEAMLRRYHDSMLRHRIMPSDVIMNSVTSRPKLKISNEAELRGEPDFAAFDRQVNWAMGMGQTMFCIDGPKKVSAWNETWYRAVADHLEEMGWSDNFYTYMTDETYEGVAEMTAMIRRGGPRLRNMITRLPKDGFPDVDIWCPRLGDAQMRAAEIDRWLAANGQTREDLWVYTAGNAGGDVPALHLDVPGIEARITPLTVWKERYGGFLFWCVNYWTVDPWVDPMVYPRQNGNGSLYYPGPDGPVESIRLKMLRDGFDDVDYAQLLQDADDDLADRILEALPVGSALNWERDPHSLTAWRLAAGYYLGGQPDLAAGWISKLAADDGDPTQGRSLINIEKPGRGWHGGGDSRTVTTDSGDRVFEFELREGKEKIWRTPFPRNLEGYREVVLDISLIEGDPVRLGFKLASGLIKRQRWTWEIHMPPGEVRRVRIPIPHERVATGSITELALFIWEPESTYRFRLEGMWLR